MKVAKGFRGRYFSLAAILAVSAGVSLASANDSLKKSESDKAIESAINAQVARYAQSSDESGVGVEVWDSEDIKNSYAQNVYEFLGQKTLLSVTPSYGNPFTQKLDLRGFGENGYQNIAIVVDGIKWESIEMLPISLSFIPLDAVEKIEIIRGKGAVKYGAGSSAGVLKITTRRKSGGLLHLSSGSYKTHDGRVYGRYVKDTLNIGAYAQGLNTDGDRQLVPSGGERDFKKNRNAGASLFYTPSESLVLRIAGDYGEYDAKYAGALTKAQLYSDPSAASAGYTSYTHYFRKDKHLNTGATYHVNDSLSFDISAGGSSGEGQYKGSYPVHYKYRGKNLGTSVDFTLGSHDIELGIERKESLRHQDGGDIVSKDSSAVYGIAKKSWDEHRLRFGTRGERVEYERNDKESKHKNLRGYEVSWEYQISGNNEVFASFTRAFVAPDVDRFFKWGGGFNEFIKPQRSDTYQLGYLHRIGVHGFGATLFFANLNGEIYYDPISWANTNIDKSQKRGIELSHKAYWSERISTTTQYSYVKSEIKEEIQGGRDFGSSRLPGSAHHTLALGIAYKATQNLNLQANYKYISRAYAYEDFANTQTKQPSYQNLSFGASYEVGSFELYAFLNNALRKTNAVMIREDAYYPHTFDRSGGVGVKYFF